MPKITRRVMVGGLAALGAGLAARASRAAAVPDLAANVAEILMLGFSGSAAGAGSVTDATAHVTAGRACSVVFRKMNIGSRSDVADLIAGFSQAGAKPLLALDHEGGFVQRLTHGYTQLPPAKLVAEHLAPAQAKELYAVAAQEFAGTGFNLNLAPVVDLDDPDSPAIGHFGRAFSRDPGVVAVYAAGFVEAFAAAGVHCALKHFPGEGLATEDSHETLPDITATWSPEELQPYVKLIGNRLARVIMIAHVRLTSLDPSGVPIAFSTPVITGLLRHKLGYDGVIMTDDLDMGAIADKFGRREAIIRALAAGNDLLMVCNTEKPDADLPQHAVEWVSDAIAKGRLTVERVAEAANRVRPLRGVAV